MSKNIKTLLREVQDELNGESALDRATDVGGAIVTATFVKTAKWSVVIALIMWGLQFAEVGGFATMNGWYIVGVGFASIPITLIVFIGFFTYIFFKFNKT